MSVFYILMGVSVVLGGAFLAFFVWAVRSGQFDDTGTPPLRVLGEGDDSRPEDGTTTEETKRT